MIHVTFGNRPVGGRSRTGRRLIATVMVASTLGALAISCPPGAVHPAGSRFLYAHDDGAPNQLFAFGVNGDGTLEPVTGSPFDTGNSSGNCRGYCETAAFSANKKLLFASGGGGISVLRVAPDGSLSLVDGSPFGGLLLVGVAVVEKEAKTFVYGADVDNSRVLGFQVQPDATLAPLATSPFPAGFAPQGMAAARNLLFVANAGSRSISAYKVKADGSLVEAPRSPFTPPGQLGSFSVNVDPSASFVYGGAFGAPGQVYGFRVNRSNGALTRLRGSPFSSGAATGEGVAISRRPVLFALGHAEPPGLPDVQAFRRSDSGALTALGAGVSAGIEHLDGGALDPSGRFLAAASSEAHAIRSFVVDRRTGGITVADTETADAFAFSQVFFVTP